MGIGTMMGIGTVIGDGFAGDGARQALAAAERERHRARRYFEAAQTMLIGLDPEHRITLVNRKGCEVLGCEEAELVGRDWFEAIVAPGYRGVAFAEFQALLNDGAHHPRHCEYEVLTRSGARRLIVWRCVVVDDVGQASEVLCSGDDVTDSRQAELAVHLARERMMSVARLATVGEMASGISHELNQPLAAIANYAQASLRLLASDTSDFADLSEAQEQIVAQALRAGEIIRRLRNLTRTHESNREGTDLNELIAELDPLMRADARAREARVVMQLAAALPPVRVDRLQIQHVVLNLVRNAIDAVATAPAERREIIVRTGVEGPATVVVSVVDRGAGLDPVVRERLFTPFVTTKQSGTGLGLTVSRTIVESHRGRLDYRPGVPYGSSFVFSLPADSGGED